MEELIQREHPQKLYIQLVEILKNKIQSGEWPLGSQIPTEDELCKTYAVSRSTVRTAVLELVKQGLLIRQQGKGTFICKKVISTGLTMLTTFKELMLEAGVNFSTRLLARTMIMPTDDLDIKLNISEDRHVIYIKRLRSIDNDPVLLKETYIPYHICPPLLDLDVENNSVFDLLESRCSIKITRAKSYIEVTHVNKGEGELLGLPEGSAALLFTQQLYSDDALVKYTRTVKRSDRFRFFIEVERRLL
jgi:DNA-binding GntR family transcriptional regulator